MITNFQYLSLRDTDCIEESHGKKKQNRLEETSRDHPFQEVLNSGTTSKTDQVKFFSISRAGKAKDKM